MSSEQLYLISRQLNLYVGPVMFVLGVIGCIWNIFIFRYHSFRTRSCCFYMWIGSWASLIQILFGLISRILSDGFNINSVLTDPILCKFRFYITQTASLTALSCFVWTALDRFFSTCRQVKWRRLTTISIAKQLCLFTVIFWMITAIPHIIYTISLQVSPGNLTCTSSSWIWSTVLTYFINLLCYGILPWTLMSVFGCLTLRNVRVIRQQRVHPLPNLILVRMTRVDRQLTTILFIQIVICLLSSIPYCIQSIYNSLTQTMVKSSLRQAQEYLFLQIVRLAFYLNYISMFYANFLASRIFRHLSKKVLKNLFKRRLVQARNNTTIDHSRRPNRRTTRVNTIEMMQTTSGL